MPLHLDDLDVVSEVAGVSSALIVPCNMCPAVTVALREGQPYLRLFRDFLKSAPFDRHIRALRSRLQEVGVGTEVFTSNLPHHFFVCIWTAGRRKRLQQHARQHEAVIVLGCESATETVRDAVQSTGCKVVQGMEVAGFLNARPRFHLPCDVTFEGGKIVPMSQQREDDRSEG